VFDIFVISVDVYTYVQVTVDGRKTFVDLMTVISDARITTVFFAAGCTTTSLTAEMVMAPTRLVVT